jgi:hypothetical protein
LPQTTIAIVSDCDDTLAQDTTGQLLEMSGVNSQQFFAEEAASLVAQGWDPTLAYMNRMVALAAQDGPLSDLTLDKFQELGQRLVFFPGVPECFDLIKAEIESEPSFRDAGVRVESYVISGGIAELLRASPLEAATHHIWGCNFSYDERGVIAFPKNVISFTEKTRFLFRINKGQVGPSFESQPYTVNQPMEPSERPVPFENMIYIGDGPSDIPCMSLLQSTKGFVIGVSNPTSPTRTWALAYGRRTHQTVDRDFTQGGSAYNALREAALQKALAISNQASPTGPVPHF